MLYKNLLLAVVAASTAAAAPTEPVAPVTPVKAPPFEVVHEDNVATYKHHKTCIDMLSHGTNKSCSNFKTYKEHGFCFGQMWKAMMEICTHEYHGTLFVPEDYHHSEEAKGETGEVKKRDDDNDDDEDDDEEYDDEDEEEEEEEEEDD